MSTDIYVGDLQFGATADGSRHLLLAILSQAIRDTRNADQMIRVAAQQWLADDPVCVAICDLLGYSLSELHQTIGLGTPQH